MRTLATLCAFPLVLAVAGTFALAACGARELHPSPNVLLISLDSVRRDMLGVYGGSFAGRSPSPNLDRLAAAGLRVEDALSTTSWTLPAHVTLFTGLPELVHGVEQDGQAIGAELATLPELLRAAGYRTAGVYSGPYLDPRFGFGRGFERYEAGYGPALAAAAQTMAETLARVHALDGTLPRERRYELLQQVPAAEAALESASHRDSSSRSVTELLLAELGRAANDTRPFFLFAHYFDPHYDYVPPPPFERDFDPGYAGPVDGRDFVRRLADARGIAERDREHLRALHAGELAATDAQIGRILAELERRGLAESTLVVVVADHGEEFLEHGAFGHRRTLYEEVVRVPMLMRFPERFPADTSLLGPVSLADVAPTVLELVGLRAELDSPRAGLMPRLAGAAASGVLGRLVLNPSSELAGVRVLESYRLGSLKLLREGTPGPQGARELKLRWIDLDEHPEEREGDWSADFADPRAREALAAFRRDHAELVRARRTPTTTEKTDDLLAAFRGLGYAGEEARVGAVPSDALVLPPPGEGD